MKLRAIRHRLWWYNYDIAFDILGITSLFVGEGASFERGMEGFVPSAACR